MHGLVSLVKLARVTAPTSQDTQSLEESAHRNSLRSTKTNIRCRVHDSSCTDPILAAIAKFSGVYMAQERNKDSHIWLLRDKATNS